MAVAPHYLNKWEYAKMHYLEQGKVIDLMFGMPDPAMGLSLDRIFKELRDVPLHENVWPKFMFENAKRLLKH